MSPLLGALGDSSEYAYRGTLDDIPTDFSLTNVTGAEPGVAYTTGPVTINGINNTVRVSVGTGASIAVNSGIFTSGPGFIRNGQTVAVRIPTTSGSDNDFGKTYSATLTVGRTSKQWSVTTRTKDSTPDAFTFTNSTNQNLGITSTSNTITISGLDATIPSNAAITSGIGSFRKNGGAPGTATTIGNGDTLAIVLAGPTDYSKTNSTSITVGDYTTSYSISTRDSDTTVNQFTFTNFTNVGLSSAFDSNSITLSGADTDTAAAPVPLTATVSGGFLKVVRGSTTVRDFSASSATVYNGDILTLRVNSSPSYSTSTSASLSITGANTPVGVASTFTVTTRPIVSDTIPTQFTFVDKSGQGRNIATISDPITIVGMTTHADDFGTAFITTTTDGGEFRVTRGGSVVRGFSTESYQVRNNDIINLRLTTSPASNGSVQTRFNVTGSDNTDINNIINQTISDTWVVQSAVRNCPLVAPTFTSITGVNPSSLQSVTFIPTSYDSDCGVVVNTSNANSYLDVNGTTGNNIVVLPGVACTVYMTAGSFSQTRSTTVTLTANNNLPSPTSTSSSWSVSTRSSNDPTVTLTASPSSVSCNQNTTLTWSTTSAVSVTTNGFTGVGTNGSLTVGPLKANTSYSITATGPDGTTATSSSSVVVSTTAAATLTANSTSIAYNGSVTLSWSTSNASSVVSNFGATATSGSITLNNLKSSQTYTLRAISNGGCADSPTQTVTINVAACSEIRDVDTGYSGITLNYTYANPGNGFDYYFSSLSGDGTARAAQNSNGSRVWDGNGTGGTTIDYFQVPDGVYQIYGICRGGGGGGGGGGPALGGGGGGGGGQSFGTIYTSPGTYFVIRYGPGGLGAPSGGAGNTPNNNGTGSFAGQGHGASIQDINGNDILRGRGAWGGGRNWGGAGGGGTDYYGNGLPNVNNTGNGGVNNGDRGAFPFQCNGGNGGGSYRTGGRGGNCNQAGSQGVGSWVYISWNVSIEGASWSTLIGRINSTFRSSYNRPPNSNEMDYWIGQYVGSTITLTQLESSIRGSGYYRSSTGAVTYCGSTL